MELNPPFSLQLGFGCYGTKGPTWVEDALPMGCPQSQAYSGFHVVLNQAGHRSAHRRSAGGVPGTDVDVGRNAE